MIPARRVIFTIVALIAIALLRRDGFTQQSAAGTTVLTGATLIDGTGRAAIPESVIVIDDGKFTAVGGKETNYPATQTSSMSPANSSYRDWSTATPIAGPFAASCI